MSTVSYERKIRLQVLTLLPTAYQVHGSLSLQFFFEPKNPSVKHHLPSLRSISREVGQVTTRRGECSGQSQAKWETNLYILTLILSLKYSLSWFSFTKASSSKVLRCNTNIILWDHEDLIIRKEGSDPDSSLWRFLDLHS